MIILKKTTMKNVLLFGVLLMTSFSYGQLNVGLIAQYDFSGDALDASGNNYNGTISGATLVNDRGGNPSSAYSFDGIDNRIEVAGFPTNYDHYSYCAWVKAQNLNLPDKGILMQVGTHVGQSANMVSFGLATTGTTDKFLGRHRADDGTYISAPSVNNIDLIWHFITTTYDGDSLKLYIDGTMESFTLINTSAPKIDTLLIGCGRTNALPFGFFFEGVIDDIRIYNRELNECEIEELYTGINPCTTGIDEYNSSLINIYPNPSSDNFRIIGIEKLKNVKSFEITSITGARVARRDIYSSVIDISSLDNGIYLFVISHENGTEKIRFIKG